VNDDDKKFLRDCGFSTSRRHNEIEYKDGSFADGTCARIILAFLRAGNPIPEGDGSDEEPRLPEAPPKEGETCRVPGCYGRLVRRKNKATGSEFLGCSNYPDCKAAHKCEQRQQEMEL
jgi:hypothetical protein